MYSELLYEIAQNGWNFWNIIKLFEIVSIALEWFGMS
jgi:hypothetical protein